jgi:tetratricopeptide (TPR) repeat protein
MQINRNSLSAAAAALLFSTASQAQTPQPQLTSEFVYKYLVGEVAAQRGEIGLASSLFYELAKSSHSPQIAERATRAAVYGQQPQQAIRAATLWAELDPASVEARQALAQMLLTSGKLNEARPHLQKLLADPEGRAGGFLYLNGMLAQQPDKEAVLRLVQELAKPYPELPEAHFTVAHSAWRAGKTDLALSELKTADQLRPGWDLAAVLRGDILLAKSPTDANDFYASFLAQYPKAREVRLTYAKMLIAQRQYEPARQQLKQLIEGGNNPEMLVVAGLLSIQLGDFVQADSYFQQALEGGYKNRDQVLLYLGQSAEEQKQDKQALNWYRMVGEGEYRFDAQLRTANVMARHDGIEAARTFLHKLPNLSSAQQVVANQLEASLLMKAKRSQEAYDLLAKTVKGLPNTPDLIYDYAMAAEQVRRFDIMEQQLRTLIVLKPDYAQAYNALGYSLADRNERLDEARKLIEQANKLSPDDHYILDSMGWVQYRLGRLDKALDYLQRAYAMQSDPEIAAHLGEVLWKQGKREEARKTWEEALRKYPDNEILLNLIKKFQ